MYQTQALKKPAKIFQGKSFELSEKSASGKLPATSSTISFSERTVAYAEIAAIFLMCVLIFVATFTVIYGAMEIANLLVELNQNQFFESVYGAPTSDFFQ
jgi:hypothetical protein